VLTRLLGDRLTDIDGIRRVGKYTVTGVLGAGAVARVFSALHPDLGLPVALKMLSHAVVHHPQFADAFDEEARLIARLSHPNVVRVFDTAEAYGTRFIVMELLEGRMLEDRITSRQPLPWPEINRILSEMTQALDHVHRNGLVHRDVKPDNIFLTGDGTAKLLDFGIAIQQKRSICKGGSRLGTPFYMPPEQILGWSLDGRTDLYALGITAYEMAARRVAYDAPDLETLLRMHIEAPPPDLHQVVPNAPNWLGEFIRRCTQKHPDARFRSAAEATSFLRAAPDGGGVARTVTFDDTHTSTVDAALRRLQRELARNGIEIELN
jgi:serine/threonine-protein kinase